MVSARRSPEILLAVAPSREGTGMTSVQRTLSRRIEWTQYNAIGREACFLPVLARGAAREVCNRAFAIREERVDD
jgi:hypothetical protein